MGERADVPFFGFVNLMEAHVPYAPPRQHNELRGLDGFRAPAVSRKRRSYEQTLRYNLGRDGFTPAELETIRALYRGEIRYLDALVGRLLDAVPANTIVAITADHGEEFLDHGQCGHYKTLYDEVLRVPLIVRYPGRVAAGRRVQGQVRLMDIGPTLFALAGIRTPRTHDQTAARSLTCFLQPAKSPKVPSLPAFGDLRGEIASLRTGDAKLIRNLRTNQEEFYDLATDPGERHDMHVNNEKADELRAMLERWRSSANGTTASEIEIDGEQKESLRSLGYLH
jgi:arylsulfatase A-like enzyme